MTKYGQAALAAVKLYRNSPALSPRSAWDQATVGIFGERTDSQKKGCPRDAFLGLCEAGLVKGIPKGSYCRSVLNKNYAIAALLYLGNNPSFADKPARLWQLLMHGRQKVHNSQMDVVLALWNQGLIVAPGAGG